MEMRGAVDGHRLPGAGPAFSVIGQLRDASIALAQALRFPKGMWSSEAITIGAAPWDTTTMVPPSCWAIRSSKQLESAEPPFQVLLLWNWVRQIVFMRA